jgi:hypothetical protein
MVKSLGDYNIEKSSSTDTKNIQWSRKNPTDIEKSKKKKTEKRFKKSSATNIIYTKKIEPKIEKIFKIKDDENIEKSKTDETGKMFQKSSVTNSNIQQGWKRKAR